MNKRLRNVALYALIVTIVILLGTAFFDRPNTSKSIRSIRYSDFLEAVEDNQISRVLISPDRGTAQIVENDGTRATVNLAPDKDLLKMLTDNDVDIAVQPNQQASPIQQAATSLIFPILLLGGLFFLFRRSQGNSGGGGNPAMNFGKSKARLQMEPSTQVTFGDVAGIEGAKLELTEVVDFLKNPDRFTAVGAKIPKGVLLVGPPGTGKTLLAKAVAGEAAVPFFSISGSEFVEMFVGVGASRVRDLFEQAKKNAPCIVFIDEIDAVGRQRGAGLGGGNDEREQTLNQLLTEMDGFEGNTGIIIVAATNRPDVLDSALMRPGRFDRQVVVDRPDYSGRLQILKVHAQDKKKRTLINRGVNSIDTFNSNVNQSEKSSDSILAPISVGVFSENNSIVFPDQNNEKKFKESEYACPPPLPSLPTFSKPPWALTLWGGSMTDSDFGEAFIFTGDIRNEYLFGIGLHKTITRSGPFSFGLEADWFRHIARNEAGGIYQDQKYKKTGNQSFYEGNIGLGAKLWLNSWLNIGVIEGLSYISTPSNYERTNREKYSQLLNYLGFEVEAFLSDRFSIVGRVHHRSGAFGTFNGVKGGSNAYLLGFRYGLGESNHKILSESNPFEIPLGCPGGSNTIRKYPRIIDDGLEAISLQKDGLVKISPLTFKSDFADIFEEGELISKTNSSSLSFYEQKSLRKKFISLLDQRIDNISLKNRFSISGRLGLQLGSQNIGGKIRNDGVRIPQISDSSGKKLITGSITRWRIQASKLYIYPGGWRSERMSFSNDPFTPAQSRIEAHDVFASEKDNGDVVITARKSRLILDEGLTLPIVKSTTISKTSTVENRWTVGVDVKDRDGLFVGYAFKPITIWDSMRLSVKPQFLLQRAINSETNSYIAKDSSFATEAIRSSTYLEDLFGIRAKLRGNKFGNNFKLDLNISTLNPERLARGSRYWSTLEREIKLDSFPAFDANLFAAYRYKVWNGSLGESDIYTAYGGFFEKKGSLNRIDLKNSYIFRLGAGRYQAEAYKEKKIIELMRTGFYTSLSTEYPLWRRESLSKNRKYSYNYSPEPITQGLSINTKVSISSLAYEDGNTQQTISLSAGPSLTFGEFEKRFFDYTNISLTSGGTLKNGSSPFAFDQAIDLGTLGIGITQQIMGPLVLNSGFEFNIDSGSDYYGKAINGKVELLWQRRSYAFSIFYNPYQGLGGFNFHLYDFNFGGTGIPFVPLSNNHTLNSNYLDNSF